MGEKFSNELAPSLGIYCASEVSCQETIDRDGTPVVVLRHLIAQFWALNQGLQSRLVTNPMTGKADEIHSTLQSWEGNRLASETKSSSLTGETYWRKVFQGQLQNDLFTYTTISENFINPGFDVPRSVCRYRKSL